MKDKHIRQYGIIMLLFLNLTGCFNASMHQRDTYTIYQPIDKEGEVLLSIEKYRRYLYKFDYQRLERFITTAKPQETVQWRKYSMTYMLTSRAIFLDEWARPCRRYQFESTSFLPFVKSTHCTETACRGTDGQWKIVTD